GAPDAAVGRAGEPRVAGRGERGDPAADDVEAGAEVGPERVGVPGGLGLVRGGGELLPPAGGGRQRRRLRRRAAEGVAGHVPRGRGARRVVLPELVVEVTFVDPVVVGWGIDVTGDRIVGPQHLGVVGGGQVIGARELPGRSPLEGVLDGGAG